MELLDMLNSIYPMSDGLKMDIAQSLKTETIYKKELLHQQGKTMSRIYFIERGLFRCYYSNSTDKEICAWFMSDGDVITSVESFFKQVPSNEAIQALEDSVVHSISYAQLQTIYKAHLEFNFIARVLTEKYYCQSEQRLFWLRHTKARDRYALFLASFPDLVRKVPSTYIASFLGITLETLSRIKKVKKEKI